MKTVDIQTRFRDELATLSAIGSLLREHEESLDANQVTEIGRAIEIATDNLRSLLYELLESM